MADRIRTLVKRIAETRPVQSARRQALLQELRALRAELDPAAAPAQAHSLDAALLLLEFMERSEDVATAETLQIVASLVGTVSEELLSQRAPPQPVQAAPVSDVTQHRDLRITQEFLLGTILVQAHLISAESLTRGLQLHASSGLPLGQCLIQLGAATPEQIASAIAYQEHLRQVERAAREEAYAPAPRVEHRPVPARVELQLSGKQKGFVQSMHNQVLGEVLIRLGAITREQLDRALQVQRATNVHIGEALVETGATDWAHIKRALEVQKQLRRVA